MGRGGFIGGYQSTTLEVDKNKEFFILFIIEK